MPGEKLSLIPTDTKSSRTFSPLRIVGEHQVMKLSTAELDSSLPRNSFPSFHSTHHVVRSVIFYPLARRRGKVISHRQLRGGREINALPFANGTLPAYR
jgi:hypothetical protein